MMVDVISSPRVAASTPRITAFLLLRKPNNHLLALTHPVNCRKLIAIPSLARSSESLLFSHLFYLSVTNQDCFFFSLFLKVKCKISQLEAIIFLMEVKAKFYYSRNWSPTKNEMDHLNFFYLKINMKIYYTWFGYFQNFLRDINLVCLRRLSFLNRLQYCKVFGSISSRAGGLPTFRTKTQITLLWM